MTEYRSKADIVSSIAKLIGSPPPPMAHGAREPKQIMCLINDRLGLGLDNQWSKVDLGQAICQVGGVPWPPQCWSRPMTLTHAGLEQVEKSVIILTRVV